MNANHEEVSAGALRGVDGWLFLVGGSNVVATLYDRSSALVSDTQLNQWASLIESRADRLHSMGIQYVHMHLPEKLTIYDNKLSYPPSIDWRLSPAVRLGEIIPTLKHADVWLELVTPFRVGREDDNLFLKTDSHWSLAGCFLGYSLLCSKIGISIPPNLLTKTSHELAGIGDLGEKFSPPVSELRVDYQYPKYAKRVYANAIARYLESSSRPIMHVGAHVCYRNESAWAARKKILIFGDSSSNISTQVLTGMLAETAQDVEFIWSSNFDWAYIARARPDVVVYELVERFMTILPHDQLVLPRRFSRESLKAEWLRFKQTRRRSERG